MPSRTISAARSAFCFVTGLYLLLSFPAIAQEGPGTLNLMPVPSKLALTGGKLRLNENFTIGALSEAGPRARKAAARFMDRLAGRTGLFFKQDYRTDFVESGNATFLFKYETAGRLELNENESYSLMVSLDRIMLIARTDLGVLHGFETLLQLLDADAQGYFIPCARIDDQPRFPWRGLLIDAGRHFMPVEVIKRNLDGMAAVKMNVLHWHLSEDQGFRVECRAFPLLHQRGSDGHYYTQDQMRDVIAYAADRGIRVMPEFDIPGHSTSWLVGYPELASGPGPYRIERRWGVFDPVFNPAEEATYRFFDKFFEEMAQLFPDRYVHIGGDENNGKQWDANPKIQLFKKDQNLADNHALQAYFNGRILAILTRLGKKMVGWDEIFQPGLPKDIVIHSWRGKQALIDSAQKGYQGLLSNGYYIDLCQPASFHYLNDPLSTDAPLEEQEQGLVLGGEATMWSELVTPETIDSRIWPRTAAIAERLWSSAEVKDVEDMYRRLDSVAVRLEELGLTHFKNQEMLLRRLAGGADIGPLRTLVDVIEPLKQYRRQNQGVTYSQLSPMTRAVDAAAPESRAARIFRKMTDEFLQTRDAKTADALKTRLQLWRSNHRYLRPLLKTAPALAELEPLSEDLYTVADLGIQALDSILARTTGDRTWVDESLGAIQQAKKPRAQTELAILPAIEKLVQATLSK
jgi:hexosaminidase